MTRMLKNHWITLTVLLVGTICVVGIEYSNHKGFSSSSEASVTVAGKPTSQSPLAADAFSFEQLLDAIEWVESRGDPNAVGADGEIGAFQISKIYVDDVNRIHRIGHTSKYRTPVSWGYYARSDKVASRWMVRTYLQHYGGTIEEMARKHNGGPQGHLKASTLEYWGKVKKRILNIQQGTSNIQPKTPKAASL